ncbi:MAG: cyclically-permuted mutarotase family protein, partial [Muribaculaceae bacterium]|nr:cyclically-permuted mutarotase family protein [Muribaculaceae bacterium]
PRLYLWGGFASKDDKRDASLETDGLEYNPANGKWRRIDGPKTESGEEISTAGGTASTLPDGRIILTGGVHKDIFLAALSNQAPDYLSHPIEWYRFNSRVLVFDPTTEKWNLMTEDKDTARAGANAIVLPDGTIMLVGGELKPRVRTPRISILRP